MMMAALRLAAAHSAWPGNAWKADFRVFCRIMIASLKALLLVHVFTERPMKESRLDNPGRRLADAGFGFRGHKSEWQTASARTERGPTAPEHYCDVAVTQTEWSVQLHLRHQMLLWLPPSAI